MGWFVVAGIASWFCYWHESRIRIRSKIIINIERHFVRVPKDAMERIKFTETVVLMESEFVMAIALGTICVFITSSEILNAGNTRLEL